MTDIHTYDDQPKQDRFVDHPSSSDLSSDQRETSDHRLIRDTAVMDSMMVGGLFF